MSENKKVSRHIPKKIDEAIRIASGFKCAWCGVHLTERHHIEPFYIVQEHTEDNLILLCPNCHAEATSGKISADELKTRRIALTGEIDRASGSLSIAQGEFQIDVGGNHFIKCENILMFNDNPLLSVENDKGYLLVSMKIFNESGNLVCWMSRNRWWIENSSILDFRHSKNNLTVIDKDGDQMLNIAVRRQLIEINGYLFIKGNKISFSKEKIEFGQGNRMIDCTFIGLNAVVFSDDAELPIRAGIKIKI